MSDRKQTAAYYRLRAKQLREIALAMTADHHRDILMQCANDYDHLARMQETLAREDPPA